MIHAYQGMHIHMFSASQPTTLGNPPIYTYLCRNVGRFYQKKKKKIVTGITTSLFILERLLGHITWQSEVFYTTVSSTLHRTNLQRQGSEATICCTRHVPAVYHRCRLYAVIATRLSSRSDPLYSTAQRHPHIFQEKRENTTFLEHNLKLAPPTELEKPR